MADYKSNAADPIELAPIDPGGSATGQVSERAQYQIDWTDQLNADLISSSAWYITGNVQEPSGTGFADSTTGALTKVWLEAKSTGVTGDIATVTNEIVTTGGARYARSFTVTLKSR